MTVTISVSPVTIRGVGVLPRPARRVRRYGCDVPVVTAVVSPHPPLLVPEMAVRAAEELDELRAACAAALDRMWAAEPDALVVVGSGPTTREYDSSAIGTFAGFGEPLTVTLGGSTGDAAGDPLPLSLTVGAWLLRDRPPVPPRRGWSIAAGASPDDCARLGSALAAVSARVGLLVMGDGSARNGPKSPGYEDPRAPAFDATVTAALAKG